MADGPTFEEHASLREARMRDRTGARGHDWGLGRQVQRRNDIHVCCSLSREHIPHYLPSPFFYRHPYPHPSISPNQYPICFPQQSLSDYPPLPPRPLPPTPPLPHPMIIIHNKTPIQCVELITPSTRCVALFDWLLIISVRCQWLHGFCCC